MIIQLSNRKQMKRSGRQLFDNFTTIQEFLTHGSRDPTAAPIGGILSVTTVWSLARKISISELSFLIMKHVRFNFRNLYRAVVPTGSESINMSIVILFLNRRDYVPIKRFRSKFIKTSILFQKQILSIFIFLIVQKCCYYYFFAFLDLL